jgi:hypothetical protein
MTVSLRKMQQGAGPARECGLYLKFLSGGNLPLLFVYRFPCHTGFRVPGSVSPARVRSPIPGDPKSRVAPHWTRLNLAQFETQQGKSAQGSEWCPRDVVQRENRAKSYSHWMQFSAFCKGGKSDVCLYLATRERPPRHRPNPCRPLGSWYRTGFWTLRAEASNGFQSFRVLTASNYLSG